VDGGLNSSWIVNGTKGVDFAGNLDLFDFATVHLCKSLLPLLPPNQSASTQGLLAAFVLPPTLLRGLGFLFFSIVFPFLFKLCRGASM